MSSLEAQLDEMIADNPVACIAKASKDIVIQSGIETSRVAASNSRFEESRTLKQEALSIITLNLGIIAMALHHLNLSVDAVGGEGFSERIDAGMDCVLTEDAVLGPLGEAERAVVEFIDCFFIRLSSQTANPPNADLFIYGRTRASVFLEAMLAPLRLAQFARRGLLDVIDARLRDYVRQNLPYDQALAGMFVMPDKDLVHAKRDPGSKFMWRFEYAVRLTTLLPINGAEFYSKLLGVMSLLCGVLFHSPTIPRIDEDRQEQRRFSMLPETVCTRYQLLRFELRLMTNLISILQMGNKVITVSRPFAQQNDPDFYNKAEMKLMRPLGIMDKASLKSFWRKFCVYIKENGLSQGQAQRFQTRLFGSIIAAGGVEAANRLQPLRVEYETSQSEETSHPEDFRCCIYMSGFNMGVNGLVNTYLDLRSAGSDIRHDMSRNGSGYHAARAARMRREVEQRTPDDLVRRAGELAPECFVLDGTLHRRAVILAFLSYLDARLENASIPGFLKLNIINCPIDETILDRAGAIPRFGGEMAIVTTSHTLMRIPDQDPLVFCACYVGLLYSWATNTKVNPVVQDFVRSIRSFQLPGSSA